MRDLRLSVVAEVGVVVLVLAATAILVNTATGRESYAPPANAVERFDTGGPNGTGTVDVAVTPARLGGNQVTIVIAKQAIPIRHQITAADLDTEKVNGSFASVNTYTRPSDVTGQGLIAEVQITKGAVITADMLAKDINLIPSGAAPAYLPLAKGYIAMTIPTGELQGIAFYPTKGDYITVIASGTVTLFSSGGVQAPGPPRVVSKTVFTNIRIIALGPAAPNVPPISSR